jgi:fructose-1,6-bisphosphatase II / sedoheptulose-1,7-bisphosphatase
VIHAAQPEATDMDIYMGIGGAPEGILAAAALRCIGGQMQCRLVLDTAAKCERAATMGITSGGRKYRIEDMVRGDCVFAATGVANGSMLRGVTFRNNITETETVVMRSATGMVRWIRAEHKQHDTRSFASTGARASDSRAAFRKRRQEPSSVGSQAETVVAERGLLS